MDLLASILVTSAYPIYWIATYCKTKTSILVGTIISQIPKTIGFVIKENATGIIGCITSIIRYSVATLVQYKSKKVKVWAFSVCLAMILAVFVLQFEGWRTVCVMISTIIIFAGKVFGGAQTIRMTAVVGGGLNAIFMLISVEWGGFAIEVVTLLWTLFTYIKYRKEEQKEDSGV